LWSAKKPVVSLPKDAAHCAVRDLFFSIGEEDPNPKDSQDEKPNAQKPVVKTYAPADV
jgi:hypothetical protein